MTADAGRESAKKAEESRLHPHPLNPRQTTFADAVARGWPVGQAAVQAGYSDPKYGSRLMRDPRVREHIRQVRQETEDAVRAAAVAQTTRALTLLGRVFRVVSDGLATHDPDYALRAGSMLGAHHTVAAAYRALARPDQDDAQDQVPLPAVLEAVMRALEPFPEAADAVAVALSALAEQARTGPGGGADADEEPRP